MRPSQKQDDPNKEATIMTNILWISRHALTKKLGIRPKEV